MSHYKELAEILRQPFYGRFLSLAKGNNEISYLKKWLQKEIKIQIDLQGEKNDSVTPSPVDLKMALENCNKCDDVTNKKLGFGSGKNGVMIILNAPKLLNKLERDLFKDESIELLKKIISSIKVDFNECYITNLIKCDLDSSLTKPSQIMQNCSIFLEGEIKEIAPHTVIVMGELLPLQKIIKESVTISWFNIEHPITLIKNPELKRTAWQTLKVVIERLKNL